jgi:hypothetical protein
VSEQGSEPRTKDGRTGKEVLAKVLSQPETAEIAKTLGLDVNDYAELVVHYALHPDEEIDLHVMDEAQAKAAGMPSPAECVAYLQKIDATPDTEVTHFAGYDDEERSSVTLTGMSAPKRAPAPGEAQGRVEGDESPKGAALKSQVLAARDRVRAGELRPGKVDGRQDAAAAQPKTKQSPAPAAGKTVSKAKGRKK